MEDKEKLNKIHISLMRHVEGRTFAGEDKLDPAIIPNFGALLFFANLFDRSGIYEKILNSIKPFDKQMKIESYLLLTLKSLKTICGVVYSDIIMMNTVNQYLNNPKKFKNVEHISSKIIKELNGLINFANVQANLAAKVTQRGDEERFLYAIMFDYFGGMEDKVSYGVCPCYVDGILQFDDVYTVKSAEMCFVLDLIQIARENAKIKKCSNCNKYFVPTNRSDEKYCNNEYKNGKTCKQLGYEIKANKDDFISAYRTSYKTKNAYKNRNISNNPHAEDDFKKWAYEAKIKLKESQNGIITLEEFKKWLKQ